MSVAVSRPIDIQKRLVELGRIRLGEKGEKGEPRKRTTFRLTSASSRLLEAVAAVYGGQVRPWKGAPDEGYFELATDSAELDILIPPALAAYSQAYELWQGGTCERRCDGTTERLSGQPCLCDPESRECQVTTRVSVMLPRVPGLGVWRLDTKGWNAATTLPATLELLGAMARGGWVPALLRMEQRSRKVRDPKTRQVQTRRFVVPVVDIAELTVGQLVTGEVPAGAVVPALPAGRRERVARPALPAGPEPPTETAFAAHTRPAETPPVGADGPAAPPPPPAGGPAATTPLAPSDRATPTPAPNDAGLAPCGAEPPPGDPLGLMLPCELRGAHTVHRSREGTWPA